MHMRIIKIIECLPEEKILLKLFTLNDSVDESLKNFEDFIKTGKKSSKKDDKTVDNLDDLFKDLNTTTSNTKKPLIDHTDLFLQDSSTPTKYDNEVDQEFSNLSHRKEKPPKKEETNLDDLFGELSYRKEPQQQTKPLNSLFDFDAIDDTNQNKQENDVGLFDFDQSSNNQSKTKIDEVNDLFGDEKKTDSSYDEFQQFLESQIQKKTQNNNPFE